MLVHNAVSVAAHRMTLFIGQLTRDRKNRHALIISNCPTHTKTVTVSLFVSVCEDACVYCVKTISKNKGLH